MGETRNNLNLEEELQLSKMAKRKALKRTLVIGLIFDVILAGIALWNTYYSYGVKIVSIAFLQIVIIIYAFMVFKIYYLFILTREKSKLYGKLAEACLSTTEWTQVIPVKADDYQEFVLNELPKRAKFFAKIQADSDAIDVSLKFNNEQEYIHWKKICTSLFLSYYSVIEESEGKS